MRRRASPALARGARSAANNWSAACFAPHAAVPRTGARALTSMRSADLFAARASGTATTTVTATAVVPRSTYALLLLLRQPSSSLRRTFASGRTRKDGSNSSVSSALSKQSVSTEHFDELKAFLMEPTTQGDAAVRAKEIVSTMMQQHVFASMPGQEATVMVMVADAMEDYAFAIEVYACLRDARVSPSPLTLELTALACAEVGDWKTATEVVARMHDAIDVMHPSSEIYENAIAACCRTDKWMKAKQLLDEMLTYGLDAAPETHLSCLALSIAANEVTASRTLLARFLATFEFEPDEVAETLRELFDQAITAASLDHALLFRDELLQRSGTDSFDQRACAALVQLCGMQRQWHRARAVLAQFHGEAPPPAPHSSQYMRDISALLHDLARHGFAVGLPLYNAALRNYGQLSQHDDAQRVFTTMLQRGVEPDAVSFAAVIAACGVNVADADRLFYDMERRGIAPSLDACHAVLLAPSRACAWQSVLDRYSALVSATTAPHVSQQALEQDARIQSLVAVAHGRLAQHERMLQVFTSMKVRGLRPNLYVYGEAMYAYIHMDQWRHALLLFDHIQHEGIEPRKLAAFAMIWDAAVLAAVTGEQVDRTAALFDRIVALRVPISPHTAVMLIEALQDVPVATLWDTFRLMTHLHRVRKAAASRNTTSANSGNGSPKVLNAALKRAVDERDVYFAEKLVAAADDELALVLNSMTYSLMLRLYADREDAASFRVWCDHMADAGVKITVFTFRAVLQHLSVLNDDNGDDNGDGDDDGKDSLATIASINRLLDLNLPDDAHSGDRIGALVLDSMERRGLPADALCCEFYLRLSSSPQHATRVLSALERAPDGFHFSSGLLHALFVTLGAHPEQARVRAFLVKCLEELPHALVDDALAAFCSASTRDSALALLQTLLARNYELSDEQVVLFLVNAAPAVGDTSASGSASASDGALSHLAAVLKAADAPLESGSMAFLIQQVIELSRADSDRVATDLDAMQDLLVHALSGYAREQVHEFLAQVVAPADAEHIEGVLRALERAGH